MHALDVFGKLGDVRDAEVARWLLELIGRDADLSGCTFSFSDSPCSGEEAQMTQKVEGVRHC